MQTSPTVVASVNRVYSTGIAAKYVTSLATSGSTLSPSSTFCDAAQNGNNFLNSTTVSATNFYDSVTTCSGYTTKTTSELQDRSSGDVYSTAGWDFSTVWKWPSASPAYPVLQWMAE